MKGHFLPLYFLFTNLLLSQPLFDLVNNKLIPEINRYNLGKNVIIYATDYKKSYLINNNNTTKIDTTFYLDDDINLLIAAISIKLFDEERFNIYSTVTALIPGSTEPYLPNSDDYELPFKGEITSKDLITQRSGIYIVNDINNYIYSDSNFIYTIDSLASFISKNKLFIIDPNVSFSYNKFNYLLLVKILDRILNEKINFVFETYLKQLLQQSKYKLELKLTPYQLALYYRNIIKNEKVINKRLINNYLLNNLPINNYFVEYALGCYYFKNLGYGNISVNDKYVKISIYNYPKDIFLIFFVKAEKIEDYDILNNETIIKITDLLSKLEVK